MFFQFIGLLLKIFVSVIQHLVVVFEVNDEIIESIALIIDGGEGSPFEFRYKVIS